MAAPEGPAAQPRPRRLAPHARGGPPADGIAGPIRPSGPARRGQARARGAATGLRRGRAGVAHLHRLRPHLRRPQVRAGRPHGRRHLVAPARGPRGGRHRPRPSPGVAGGGPHPGPQCPQGRARHAGGRPVRPPLRAGRTRRHGAGGLVDRDGARRLRDDRGPGRGRSGDPVGHRLLALGGQAAPPSRRGAGVPSMTRLVVLSGLLVWTGATVLLAELRWFSRLPLLERLRPYTAAAAATPSRAGLLSVESLGEVLGPVARGLGERVARVFGVSEELALRLERIHSPLDVTAFRIRQLGVALCAFGVASLASLAIRPAPPMALVLLLGAPLLAFLALEQQVASASATWQRRLFLELPVVAEQLAMLLSAGFSLGAALNRRAARGKGNAARDLARVCGRMTQGLSEVDALRDWAAAARVEALDRLVPMLGLNSEAADLGRLVSDEARSIRREVHRRLVETMERRGQQVWIPVTVATLVPGVIFLAIPFIEALRLFAGP